MVIIKTMKRGIFFIGLGFLALAFISGAAEIAAQGITKQLRAYMAISEVWQILSPETLSKFRDDGVGILGSRWQTVELFMLLPGWLLFGLPGLIIALVFRDHDTDADKDHEDSVFLYDALAKRAHDEGMDDASHGDDVMPSTHIRTEPAGKEMADENINTDDYKDHDDKPDQKPG